MPNLDCFVNRPLALRIVSAASTNCSPLIHKRGQRDSPAFTDIADAKSVRHASIGHVDLVELCFTGYLSERTDFNTRCVHVKREVRHAFVLWLIGVGSRDKHSPVGEVGECVPHLLPIHDPFVTVAYGLCSEACEVAAGARLREQLTPFFFARVHRTKESCLHFFAAVSHDGWTCKCDEKGCWVLGFGAGFAATLFDKSVQIWTKSKSAVPFRKMDPRETVVETRSTKRAVIDGLGVELGQQLVNCCFDDGELLVCGGLKKGHDHSLARKATKTRNRAGLVGGWSFVTFEAAVPMDPHIGQLVIRADEFDRPTELCVKLGLEGLLKLCLTHGVPGLHGLPHEDDRYLPGSRVVQPHFFREKGHTLKALPERFLQCPDVVIQFEKIVDVLGSYLKYENLDRQSFPARV